MSNTEPNNSDSKRSNEHLLPKVIVACAGKDVKLNCDYPNIEYRFSGEVPIAQFFNNIQQTERADFFLFTRSSFDFVNTKSLEAMVNYLNKDDNYIVDGLYSDTIIRSNSEERDVILPSPSYSTLLDLSRITLDIPFIIKSRKRVAFDTNFEVLILWKTLADIIKNMIIFNFPHPCFYNSRIFGNDPRFYKEYSLISNE